MRLFSTANLVVSNFRFTFAYKFNDNFCSMQENENKNSALTIQGYYQTLGKKDKSQLINYLMQTYGFGYSSLQYKLNGRRQFNPRDTLVVQTVINNQLWKNK